jgi:hypothetical protein
MKNTMQQIGRQEKNSMQYDVNNEQSQGLVGRVENIIKTVAAETSTKVKQKYEKIDLTKIPDHVNYSKVEKYLRSIDVEITRRMFISYLKDELLPGGHEMKNSRYSYYTREQIIYYLLVDMFKPILQLDKVKVLFNEILSPIIADIGLDTAFETMCKIIIFIACKYEDAVLTAVTEENMKVVRDILDRSLDAAHENAQYNMKHFTSLVTLCMARGGLDYYKYSPYALLE